MSTFSLNTHHLIINDVDIYFSKYDIIQIVNKCNIGEIFDVSLSIGSTKFTNNAIIFITQWKTTNKVNAIKRTIINGKCLKIPYDDKGFVWEASLYDPIKTCINNKHKPSKKTKRSNKRKCTTNTNTNNNANANANAIANIMDYANSTSKVNDVIDNNDNDNDNANDNANANASKSLSTTTRKFNKDACYIDINYGDLSKYIMPKRRILSKTIKK